MASSINFSWLRVVALLRESANIEINKTRHASDEASASNCAPWRVSFCDAPKTAYEAA